MALVTASSINFDIAQQHHVIGYYIYDVMDKDVASIRDLLVDQESHLPRYAVIEIGGMLSIIGKKILIPWVALTRGGISRMDIAMASEQIQAAPIPLSQLAPTRTEEESIHRFFNVTPYWLEELEIIDDKKAPARKPAPLDEITEKLILEKDERK